MNTTLNIDSAGRVLAPDEGPWTTILRTESESSLTGTGALRVTRAQPWLWYVRGLLQVIAGVFAILYALGAPALVIVLLVYMFTR